MLFLVEHFYSIQGEGMFTGTPSLFFRFGGCNMRCSGFGNQTSTPEGTFITGCDSAYAVFGEFKEQWDKMVCFSDLVKVYEGYNLPKGVDVVITGGEPLIYADNALFNAFIAFLVEQNHRITFETNGSMQVNFTKYPHYRSCIFSLSVKLENSKEPKEKRIWSENLIDISQHGKTAYLKFVVDVKTLLLNDGVITEQIQEISNYVPQLPIYCMPMVQTKSELEEDALHVIEYCKKHGFIYCDRQHIRIWNDKKGI